MKKTLSAKEFYKLLRSYKSAFACVDLNANSCVYMNFETEYLDFHHYTNMNMIFTKLELNSWAFGGCLFYGNQYYCDVETGEEEAMVKFTTDQCDTPYTIHLKNI